MTTPHVLVGTRSGLHDITGGGPPRFAGRTVTAIAPSHDGPWAITDDRDIRRIGDDEQRVASLDEGRANCLLAEGDEILVGASEAGLHRLSARGLERIVSFDSAPGRDTWYTPWRGPPDVRSIARDAGGVVYVNVHVGGVLRSDDGGRWEATLDIHADVHQVAAHPTRPDHAFVASAWGLGTTGDGAATWRFDTDGLHAAYCRAVAVAEDAVFVSASSGPSGGRAALYRRAVSDGGPFERCATGLPERFTTNLDTGCLAVAGGLVVAGDESGTVYASDDGGDAWQVVASDLPGVTCVAIA